MKTNISLNKILIIYHWGRLGDAIIFSALFDALYQRWPHAEVTWIGSQKAKPLRPLLPHVQNAYFVPCTEQADTNGKWKRLFINLKEACAIGVKAIGLAGRNKYDVVIYPQRMILFKLVLLPLLAILRIPVRIGFDDGALSRQILTDAISCDSTEETRYLANRYLKLLEPLVHEQLTYSAPHLRIPIETLQQVKNRLASCEKTDAAARIVLHPGVGTNANNQYQKAWPIESWRQLLKQLLTEYPQALIYLSGGPDDAAVMDAMETYVQTLSLEFQARVVQLSTLKLSFDEYAAALSICNLLVVADTGILHLAIGLNIPTVTIFTSTSEKIYTDNTEIISVVTRNDLSCRPCLWVYRQSTCEAPVCLNVSVEDVSKQVYKHLAAIDQSKARLSY